MTAPVGETLPGTNGPETEKEQPGRPAGPVTGGGDDKPGGGITTTGGGYGSPATTGGDTDRTKTRWRSIYLTQPKAVTGGDEGTKPPDADGTDDIESRVRSLLRIRKAETRPTLVHLHVSHYGDEAAPTTPAAVLKKQEKQCLAIDDEIVARWARLYRLVRVEIDKSDPALLRHFGDATGPRMVVVDAGLHVVESAPPMRRSRDIAKFLESSVKKHFKPYWGRVEERLERQEKALQEARDLAKKKDLKGALDRALVVSRSSLRIGDHYDDAVRLTNDLRRKLGR